MVALQPGVHPHEGESLVSRLVDELDGARAPVPGGLDEPDCRGPKSGLLLSAQRWATRLLDQLPVIATLDGAVSDPRRPDSAVGVGDDLHLEVATIADQRLHEHDRIGERVLGLALAAFERDRQLIWRSDNPDTPTTPAAPGLDRQRVPDDVAMAGCLLPV